MQRNLNAFCLAFAGVLFLIGFDNASAWTEMAFYRNEAHPGKCFVNENLIMSPGEVAKMPTDCASITCKDATGRADIEGCSPLPPPPNCVWTDYKNMEEPYPMCCVRNFRCDNPANETKAVEMQNDLFELFKLEWQNAQSDADSGPSFWDTKTS